MRMVRTNDYAELFQRICLPNGNTFITEGVGGHMLEVTEEHEIVWEYVSPYFGGPLGNMVYRAYRYPYGSYMMCRKLFFPNFSNILILLFVVT